jgi:DNA-binding NarL/FixJ family response regulator
MSSLSQAPRTSVLRIAIVEDHEVVRTGLAAVLSRQPDFRVVASVGSGEALLKIVDDIRPSVVLLDHRLPGMNGAETCRELVRRRQDVAVIMLTSFSNDNVVRTCLGAGARGYLTKDVETVQLCDALRCAADGSLILAKRVAGRVPDWARRVQPGPHSLDGDEIDLLKLVAQGCSNKEIAERLHTSDRVVKMRLKTTMRKLSSSSRSAAVATALELGVL